MATVARQSGTIILPRRARLSRTVHVRFASRGLRAAPEAAPLQPNDSVGDEWPLDLAVFQPLGERADARPIEVRQLDPVGAPRPEHLNRAREWIGAHALAHQRGPALRSLAESTGFVSIKTRTAPSAPIMSRPSGRIGTVAIVFWLAPVPTRTTTPSMSISITPLGLATVRRRRVAGCLTVSGSKRTASTTAGTNMGDDAGSGARRSRRR